MFLNIRLLLGHCSSHSPWIEQALVLNLHVLEFVAHLALVGVVNACLHAGHDGRIGGNDGLDVDDKVLEIALVNVPFLQIWYSDLILA